MRALPGVGFRARNHHRRHDRGGWCLHSNPAARRAGVPELAADGAWPEQKYPYKTEVLPTCAVLAMRAHDVPGPRGCSSPPAAPRCPPAAAADTAPGSQLPPT